MPAAQPGLIFSDFKTIAENCFVPDCSSVVTARAFGTVTLLIERFEMSVYYYIIIIIIITVCMYVRVRDECCVCANWVYQIDVYAGSQLVSGCPFTLSVLPLVSPLRLSEASSSGIVGKPMPFRVRMSLFTTSVCSAVSDLQTWRPCSTYMWMP